MFIGRKRELALLEKRFAAGKFEFVGVYGRRRVGKTAPLTEFTRIMKEQLCVSQDSSFGFHKTYVLGFTE